MSFRLRPSERLAADGSVGMNRQRFANWNTSSTTGMPAIAKRKKFPSVTVVRSLLERVGVGSAFDATSWYNAGVPIATSVKSRYTAGCGRTFIPRGEWDGNTTTVS
jgi:hypothetical protein